MGFARHPQNRSSGHIFDVDRLKAGGTANQRQDRAHPAHRGEAVEKAIFIAENHRRPQDHGRGEGGQNGGFALSLAAGILRSALGIRANRRQMHQAAQARLSRQPRDAASPLRLNSNKIVGTARIKGANAVHRRIRPRQRCRNRSIIADVAEHGFHLAHCAIAAHKQRLVRAAHGHAHAPAFLRQFARDIAANKTRTAKDRDQLAHGVLVRERGKMRRVNSVA